MSDVAMIWADDVVEAEPVSRAILSKLAALADDDDCAWMTVATLARRVGVSERTVQERLRRLCRPRGEMVKGIEGLGLLRETGRTYRMGTRSVPYYELLVDHVAVGRVIEERKARKIRAAEDRSRMGATVCTHSPQPDDAICTRMGATVCTPKEDRRGEEEADASSAGVRADAAFDQVVAMWPADGLGSTDLDAAHAAVAQAVDETGDPDVIVAVVRGFLADRAGRKHDFACPALDRWMARGVWRELAKRVKAGPPPAEATTPAVPTFNGPAEAFEAVAGVKDDAFARSWLGRASWDEGERVLTVPPLPMKTLRLYGADRALAAINITLKERAS